MGVRRCPGTILPASHDSLYVAGGATLSVAALRMVPDSVYVLAHAPARFAPALAGFCIVTVIRDPRSVLVSYIRHRKREDGLDITIPAAMSEFWDWGEFVPTYRSFLGWIGKAIVLRYEDLPPGQVGTGTGIYPPHQRHLNTRTGSPSRWWDYWSGAAETAWRAHGGEALLFMAGYAGAPKMANENPNKPETTGNPNDLALRDQVKDMNEQIANLEQQIADAQGRGEDVSGMQAQLQQAAQQKQALKRQIQDARDANLDARKDARATATEQRGAERSATKTARRDARRETKAQGRAQRAARGR